MVLWRIHIVETEHVIRTYRPQTLDGTLPDKLFIAPETALARVCVYPPLAMGPMFSILLKPSRTLASRLPSISVKASVPF